MPSRVSSAPRACARSCMIGPRRDPRPREPGAGPGPTHPRAFPLGCGPLSSGGRTPSEPPGPAPSTGPPRLRDLPTPTTPSSPPARTRPCLHGPILLSLEAERVKADHFLGPPPRLSAGDLHRPERRPRGAPALRPLHRPLRRPLSLEAILSPEGAAASEPPPAAQPARPRQLLTLTGALAPTPHQTKRVFPGAGSRPGNPSLAPRDGHL